MTQRNTGHKFLPFGLPSSDAKLQTSKYGLNVHFPQSLEIDEGEMSVWVPFADGNRRDGVGDLLEVSGIDFTRHKCNPIVLFDHGKQVTLPCGLAEDPKSGEYKVEVNPVTKIARGKAYFYQGSGKLSSGTGDAYNHAVFCEQLFDMLVKRYIRAGSIGYQVIAARELPPNYETGTPKGLHLMKVLMLEFSVVVLPANADTVGKMLSMPRICGKPLSPYLVKSLAPYAQVKAERINRDVSSQGPDYLRQRAQAQQVNDGKSYGRIDRKAVNRDESGRLISYTRGPDVDKMGHAEHSQNYPDPYASGSDRTMHYTTSSNEDRENYRETNEAIEARQQLERTHRRPPAPPDMSEEEWAESTRRAVAGKGYHPSVPQRNDPKTNLGADATRLRQINDEQAVALPPLDRVYRGLDRSEWENPPTPGVDDLPDTESKALAYRKKSHVDRENMLHGLGQGDHTAIDHLHDWHQDNPGHPQEHDVAALRDYVHHGYEGEDQDWTPLHGHSGPPESDNHPIAHAFSEAPEQRRSVRAISAHGHLTGRKPQVGDPVRARSPLGDYTGRIFAQREHSVPYGVGSNRHWAYSHKDDEVQHHATHYLRQRAQAQQGNDGKSYRRIDHKANVSKGTADQAKITDAVLSRSPSEYDWRSVDQATHADDDSEPDRFDREYNAIGAVNRYDEVAREGATTTPEQDYRNAYNRTHRESLRRPRYSQAEIDNQAAQSAENIRKHEQGTKAAKKPNLTPPRRLPDEHEARGKIDVNDRGYNAQGVSSEDRVRHLRASIYEDVEDANDQTATDYNEEHATGVYVDSGRRLHAARQAFNHDYDGETAAADQWRNEANRKLERKKPDQKALRALKSLYSGKNADSEDEGPYQGDREYFAEPETFTPPGVNQERLEGYRVRSRGTGEPSASTVPDLLPNPEYPNQSASPLIERGKDPSNYRYGQASLKHLKSLYGDKNHLYYDEMLEVPHGNLTQTNIPPATWKPGVGAMTKSEDKPDDEYVRGAKRDLEKEHELRRRMTAQDPEEPLAYRERTRDGQAREEARSAYTVDTYHKLENLERGGTGSIGKPEEPKVTWAEGYGPKESGQKDYRFHYSASEDPPSEASNYYTRQNMDKVAADDEIARLQSNGWSARAVTLPPKEQTDQKGCGVCPGDRTKSLRSLYGQKSQEPVKDKVEQELRNQERNNERRHTQALFNMDMSDAEYEQTADEVGNRYNQIAKARREYRQPYVKSLRSLYGSKAEEPQQGDWRKTPPARRDAKPAPSDDVITDASKPTDVPHELPQDMEIVNGRFRKVGEKGYYEDYQAAREHIHRRSRERTRPLQEESAQENAGGSPAPFNPYDHHDNDLDRIGQDQLTEAGEETDRQYMEEQGHDGGQRKQRREERSEANYQRWLETQPGTALHARDYGKPPPEKKAFTKSLRAFYSGKAIRGHRLPDQQLTTGGNLTENANHVSLNRDQQANRARRIYLDDHKDELANELGLHEIQPVPTNAQHLNDRDLLNHTSWGEIADARGEHDEADEYYERADQRREEMAQHRAERRKQRGKAMSSPEEARASRRQREMDHGLDVNAAAHTGGSRVHAIERTGQYVLLHDVDHPNMDHFEQHMRTELEPQYHVTRQGNMFAVRRNERNIRTGEHQAMTGEHESKAQARERRDQSNKNMAEEPKPRRYVPYEQLTPEQQDVYQYGSDIGGTYEDRVRLNNNASRVMWGHDRPTSDEADAHHPQRTTNRINHANSELGRKSAQGKAHGRNERGEHYLQANDPPSPDEMARVRQVQSQPTLDVTPEQRINTVRQSERVSFGQELMHPELVIGSEPSAVQHRSRRANEELNFRQGSLKAMKANEEVREVRQRTPQEHYETEIDADRRQYVQGLQDMRNAYPVEPPQFLNAPRRRAEQTRLAVEQENNYRATETRRGRRLRGEDAYGTQGAKARSSYEHPQPVDYYPDDRKLENDAHVYRNMNAINDQITAIGDDPVFVNERQRIYRRTGPVPPEKYTPESTKAQERHPTHIPDTRDKVKDSLMRDMRRQTRDYLVDEGPHNEQHLDDRDARDDQLQRLRGQREGRTIDYHGEQLPDSSIGYESLQEHFTDTDYAVNAGRQLAQDIREQRRQRRETKSLRKMYGRKFNPPQQTESGADPKYTVPYKDSMQRARDLKQEEEDAYQAHGQSRDYQMVRHYTTPEIRRIERQTQIRSQGNEFA
jgi:hypothetical protein